jgi:hypothetical protein
MSDEEIEKLKCPLHVVVAVCKEDKSCKTIFNGKTEDGKGALKVFHYWMDVTEDAIHEREITGKSDDIKIAESLMERAEGMQRGRILKAHTVSWRPAGLQEEWKYIIMIVR